jgi:cobalt-zinc-cadmium efflux system outer membrane protein
MKCRYNLKFFQIIFINYLFLNNYCYPQVDTLFEKQIISYSNFLALVGKNNLAYSAEKFNLNIAEARILSAGIFPDPDLGFAWFDNGQRRMNMGYGFSSQLSWNLELGGKRKARIELAKSEYELTKYLLQDYFRNLRADATMLYLDAIQKKLLLNVQLNSYESMRQLALSDSIRYTLGSITKLNAIQSKLEAATLLNDVYQAEAEWKSALVNLKILLGLKQNDTLLIPLGDFNQFDRDFNLQQLIITATNNRADVLAALQNKDVSQKLLKLTKANRMIDLGLTTGILYASYTRNIIAPTPSFTSVNAGITIPLKFSNNRPGELKEAYFNAIQAELKYREVELQIETEITQAYFNYLALKKQVQQFKGGMLTDAKSVLDGKIYSYQRGETSLLEVLNAQRTYNEIQKTYYITLFNYAVALIELERSAGIWDINF